MLQVKLGKVIQILEIDLCKQTRNVGCIYVKPVQIISKSNKHRQNFTVRPQASTTFEMPSVAVGGICDVGGEEQTR